MVGKKIPMNLAANTAPEKRKHKAIYLFTVAEMADSGLRFPGCLS